MNAASVCSAIVLAACLAGCGGQGADGEESTAASAPEPLQCVAYLFDGGPRVGSAFDGGAILCGDDAAAGSKCVVPLFTVDHPSGWGFAGKCEPERSESPTR